MRPLSQCRRAGTSDRRRWLLFTILSGLLAWLAGGGMEPAGAQEPTGKAAAKEAAPARDDAPPAGGAEASPAPAANPAAPSGSAGGTVPPPPENLLSLAVQSSGLIGLLLLLISIFFVAQVIRLFMEFRVSEAVPVLADLLLIPTGGRYPPLNLTPQKRKEKTLQCPSGAGRGTGGASTGVHGI